MFPICSVMGYDFRTPDSASLSASSLDSTPPSMSALVNRMVKRRVMNSGSMSAHRPLYHARMKLVIVAPAAASRMVIQFHFLYLNIANASSAPSPCVAADTRTVAANALPMKIWMKPVMVPTMRATPGFLIMYGARMADVKKMPKMISIASSPIPNGERSGAMMNWVVCTAVKQITANSVAMMLPSMMSFSFHVIEYSSSFCFFV